MSCLGFEWWAGKDSNLRRQRRRVYSPLLLSTQAPTLELGRGDRIRTCNHRFWRPVLCQLSYTPKDENSGQRQ